RGPPAAPAKLRPGVPPPGRPRLSVVEDGQVEPAEALGVGDDVDFRDLAARDGEPEDRDRLPGYGRDYARGPVYQGRPQQSGGLVQLGPMTGDGCRAADHHGYIRTCCPPVRSQHDIWIEHRDERAEVAAARRGVEGVDYFPLTPDIGVGRPDLGS